MRRHQRPANPHSNVEGHRRSQHALAARLRKPRRPGGPTTPCAETLDPGQRPDRRSGLAGPGVGRGSRGFNSGFLRSGGRFGAGGFGAGDLGVSGPGDGPSERSINSCFGSLQSCSSPANCAASRSAHASQLPVGLQRYCLLHSSCLFARRRAASARQALSSGALKTRWVCECDRVPKRIRVVRRHQA